MIRLTLTLTKFLIILLILAAIATPFLVFDLEPRIERPTSLSPAELQASKQTANKLATLLASRTPSSLQLHNNELRSALDAFSYSTPVIDATGDITPWGAALTTSVELSFKEYKVFVNISCLVINGTKGLTFEQCRLGHLPIAGNLVEWLLDTGLEKLVGTESQQLWQKLRTHTQIHGDSLLISNIVGQELQRGIRNSLSEATALSSNGAAPDTELISAYLTDLESFSSPGYRLEDYIQFLFSRVMERSELKSPQSVAYHNQAALWAMAIKLGHRRFAYLVGLPRLSISNPNLTLKGRGDLALHFVYSVGLQLASGMEISFNLGEMKEVLDSNRGGSGFSFADLVADTAGNLFATHLTQATPEVTKATQLLANRADEDLYMPSIIRKQEGLSQAEFQRQFGSTDSDKYQAEVAAIYDEILALPLYRD